MNKKLSFTLLEICMMFSGFFFPAGIGSSMEEEK